tara:strand:- start:810 stop:1187 length:378 start_codon:yes stop_codon:yes gene_type:complete
MANTSKDILNEILGEINTIKRQLPNGELKRMEASIKEMQQDYADIKADLSDMKFTLLNPEDGVIVRVNKNSAFRYDREDKQVYYDKILTQFEKMKDWKDGVTKALWIVFTSLFGILGYIISTILR